MAQGDDLKVEKIPAAFRELAEKHNALVDFNGTPMVPLNSLLSVGLQLAEGLVSDRP